MTVPIVPNDAFDEYTDAANSIGLSVLQAADLQDYLSTNVGDIGEKFGGLVEWITDGIATVIGDLMDFITTGDSSSLNNIAEYIQEKLLEIPHMVLGAFTDLLEAFIGQYTGGDSSLLGIQNIIKQLGGIIDPSRLASIPIFTLTDKNYNLVDEWDFSEAVTIDAGQSGYYWDEYYGRTNLGSAAVAGDSDNHSLSMITAKPVTKDEELRVTGWTSWEDITGTATDGIKLMLDTFLDGAPVSSVEIGKTSPTGTQPTWQKLEGTWTVPDGVNSVAVRLFTTNTVTSGVVRFDDVSLYKIQLMKMDWIKNLLGRFDFLANLFNIDGLDLDGLFNFNDVWNNLWEGVGGGSDGLKALNWIPTVAQDVIDRIINAFSNLGSLVDTDLPVSGILESIFGIFDTGLTANNRVSAFEMRVRQLESAANTITEGFDGASGSSLGGNWTQNYTGGGAGNLALDGKGNAVWKASGAGNRTCIARYSASALTVDNGFIQVQLASTPQSYIFDDAYSYICWRMNTAGDTYMRLRIGYDTVQLQKVSAGSVSNVGTAWSGEPKAGNIFDISFGDAGNTNFGHHVVRRNEVTIINTTDGSPIYGASYRSVGLGMETGNRLIITQNIPAGFGVFTAAEVL